MSEFTVKAVSSVSPLRILSVHNRYQIRGGEEEVFDAESTLLRSMGHDVETYEENNDRLTDLNAVRLAQETIWSTVTYNALLKSFKQKPYNIVHVHNFLPLISPSVYYAARNAGIPVVQTLHNYRLLCPNALFYRDGEVCEDCLGKRVPWPGVQHGCYRNNRAASGVVATMLAAHHLLDTWADKITTYIALTEFARHKFIEGGLPAEKILVKPHFVHPDPGIGEGQGGYALYVGRLSIEKGIDTLLNAWTHLKGQLPLKIVGDGPLRDSVIAASQRMPQIEWLGRKPISEVYALLGEATVLIFPSNWYETFGRVAIEAFAKGTPVIGAGHGAISELIQSQQTGLEFRPGDPEDLASKVELLLSNPTMLKQMRPQARAEFEAHYTAEKNYHRLIEIYSKAQTSCLG